LRSYLPVTSLPGPTLASTFLLGASPLAPANSYLPAWALRSTRHVGFLDFNRRLLAMGAVVACGSMMSIQSLPASAEVLHEEVTVSELQAFASPGSFYVHPAERDGFIMTSFSLVQWPVPSTTTMSDGFGYRSCAGCSADHKGIDLTPGVGYPIEAVADGVVTEALSDVDGLGVHVIIRHVIDGQVFSSLYAHMLVGSLTLQVGDVVTRGEVVGNVGDTGSSTGPHLHFGILRSDNIEIDPEAWLHAHANSPLL
jgi:murein DD-endopeptidase MepM/ murein hydrolase activator NlpD